MTPVFYCSSPRPFHSAGGVLFRAGSMQSSMKSRASRCASEVDLRGWRSIVVANAIAAG